LHPGAGAKSHTVWVIVIPDAGIIALVTPVRLQLKRLNYQHGRPGQVPK
jgi:hypothetical protein